MAFRRLKLPVTMVVAALLAVLLAGQPTLAAGTRVDEMPPQMRQAYIVGIQEELLAHGYHVGPIDGVIGKKTKGAIRQYQRDAALHVDGVATKELLDHLKFALPKVYARGTVTQPTPLVSDIQAALQERGYYQGAVDGRNGPLTRAAIAGFQQDAGLAVTGSVGSGVLNDLRSADPSIRRN